MTDGLMVREIDWDVPQSEFRDFIREYIHTAEKSNKVLALPIEIHKGQSAIDLLTLLLAQVNCDDCDAICCKANPDGMLTQVLSHEYEYLSKKYGQEHFIIKNESAFLPMPCPFLRKGTKPGAKQLCKIYPDRPLVCVFYPFQPGATAFQDEVKDGEEMDILAVASECPEGRRITKAVFMTAWRIRHQFERVRSESIYVDLFGIKRE